MEELTFEQLQARQSGKLAPRATASPDDEELTFDQLQAKAAASTSDPSYANTDLKYAAERYLPKAAANAVEGWYNRSATRSAGGWLMEKLVSLTPEGKKAVDELDRPKAEKNDESFMETVASTLGYMAANPGHTLSEMGKDLAANPELLGIGSFGTVRGAARLADMAKLGRAGRVAATIGGSAAEGAVLMGLFDTALQLKNDEMDWKRTGVAAATGAIMAPVMHGAVSGLKKLYDLWKNGKPVEAPPTPEEPLPPHPGDIDFDRPLTAAEADARTKKGTVKRNGQPYKSMREVPPGELASVIKGLDSEAESLVSQIKTAEAQATAERAKAAKALSERIKVAEPGENGMPTPETQALQEQLRALTEPDKNGTPSPEIQALHDKLRSVNEYRDGILNNDPASPLAREVVYGQEFGKFPEGDTFDRADVTPTDAVDVSQFAAERMARPLEDRINRRADRQEQVANRFRTKEGDAEQAWQEHKAAQAKEAELEALRTEYADLEESLTRRPLPGQKRASYPKLVAALAATGVTLSAFSNMTPEERQQAFAGAAFAVGAIKAKGGTWHPKAVERLARPLKESLTNWDRVALGKAEKQAEMLANKTHADRMVKNWLQKYAGTESDPLKDLQIPMGEGFIRLEDATDAAFKSDKMGEIRPRRAPDDPWGERIPDEPWGARIPDEEVIWDLHSNKWINGFAEAEALRSWVSHVGDYLKQNVKPEDLGKYDLVRAAKETAARDEKVRQEALKDWTQPNPGRIASSSALPEVKSYAPTREGARDFSFNKPGSVQMKNTVKLPAEEVTYSWREIKLPEELTPEQAKSIRTQEPSEPGESYYYTALDANGKPIVNNFTEELAVAPTPQEAYLAGQLAQEGNALGHCVGGYAEDVAAGQSRILSLRDHLGRSYATVEIQPTTPRSPVSTFYDQASPDFLAQHPLPEGARYQSDLSREWVEFKYDISHTPEYKAWLKEHPENIAQIKGAGNGAPPEYVRPYIHDLVKSGNWADVKDLELAGLTKTPDGKYVGPDGVEPALGVPPRNPQAGRIDPDLAIRLGLSTTGAALGGYLAGDEKLAGMALGAIGGLAATRLPGLGRSLGKAISPQQAFGSAMRISAALGAGYYLGGKVDHPIEGAVLASGLLIGRRFLKPAIAREGDALINARNGNLAVWEWIRHNTKRDLTESVPDEARRTAIYEALQVGARGRLAPNEQKVFDVVTDLNAVTGRDAVDAGVLQSLRQNYVTSVVEREVVGTPNTKAELVRKIMGMAFHEDSGPSTRFAKARKYDTLQELEAALRGTGLKVKTTDVAEVLDIYLKSMRKAVEDRVLINAVKQTQASDGTPYIAKRNKYKRFPEGYKQIDHPQLGDKAVHPELYDSLKIVFESSQPDVVTAGLLGASMAIKRAQVFGSLFHAKSLGEVYVLAMGSDMLPRPGDLTRPKRIIDEALNKFRTQGLGGEIEGLIKAGIKFGIPDDISTTIIADLGALADSATGVKIGSKTAEKIDYVDKHMNKATWDYMHTGVKASVALKEVENLIRNNAELHALDPKKYRLKTKEEIYQEVATFTNDIAGGLDWFRIATQAKTELGRSIAMHFASPQGRRLAQIIAFAPDWLMSSMRAGFKSFGESDAGFRGLIKPNNAIDLYRRYALRSAAIWVTILNGMQYALTGTPVWDNKDPTRLQFPDGTSLQAAKHSMEVPHAVADPVGFALNKLGYFPSLAADTAKYYAGGGHMKQSQDSPVVYAAKKAAPFTASPLLDHNLSAGERVGRSVSGALGMPLYGYNQEQRLAARRSRLEKLQSRKQNQ